MRKKLPVIQRLPLLLVIAVFAAASPVQSKTAPTVIQHSVGVTVVTLEKGMDHVIVKDPQGNILADSWCEAGTFVAYREAFTRIKEGLARKDRAAVVKLFLYPLRVNAAKPIMFRNEAALLRSYDKIFTPALLGKIRASEPAALFCHNGLGMLDDGLFWAAMTAAGARVATIDA
jgi:hypothetical protein